MIRTRIQIGDGTIDDTFIRYGLVYLDSDKNFSSPIKDFDKTSYIEEEGEHIDPRAVEAPFDFKITFLILARNNDFENANAKINEFNRQLYDMVDGVRRYKQVTFWNPLRRTKVVGYPKPVSTATEFYRNENGDVEDAVKVELNLRVGVPSLCDWNYAGVDVENNIKRDWESIKARTMDNYFKNANTLEWFPVDLSWSGIASAYGLFSFSGLRALQINLGGQTISLGRLCEGCTNLESAIIRGGGGITSLNGVFQNCTNIKDIDIDAGHGAIVDFRYFAVNTTKIRSLKGLNLSNSRWGYNLYLHLNTDLRELTLRGIGTDNPYAQEQIDELSRYDTPPYWGVGTDEARQSLVDSLITLSADRSRIASTKRFKIWLSEASYNVLTESEIAQITAKGYELFLK